MKTVTNCQLLKKQKEIGFLVYKDNKEGVNVQHKNQLEKGYKQVKTEVLIKSIIIGFSFGFISGGLVFFIGILITKNLLLAGLITSVALGLFTGFLYYLKFKPSIKLVAERLDDLGLEERTITMIELEKSQSFMAEMQRKNTHDVLNQLTVKLLFFKSFQRSLVMLLITMVLMGTSLGFMMVRVNAANQEPNVPTEETSPDDEIFQKMIDELLSVINNSNIDVTLKNQLYGMVVDLEGRLSTYDTYLEKYADVLKTRNEILQLIADAILEIEESLMNIAEALQKYENTEMLGLALATWDENEITEAFEYMYERVEVLLAQELYDVMWQTAIDIETALAEALGTDPGMHDALQDLADAYKIALDSYAPGNEEEVLDALKEGMDESLATLLEVVQALKDMMEELEELEDEIEDVLDEVDEFPPFLPYPPEEGDTGEDPNDPNTNSENTVIDGETPYEDVYDDFYEDAMEWLTGDQLTEDMRRIIENYFKILS